MVDDRTARRDVPELRTLSESKEYNGTITDNLHRSRAKEYLFGQAAAITVAMGSVWAAHRFAPGQMDKMAGLTARVLKPFTKNQSPTYVLEQSHRTANYVMMFAGGLASSLTTQTILSRQRRAGKEYADDITLGRDLSRLMSGWSVGMIGATASVMLADTFLRRKSEKAVSDIVTRAEELLDAKLLKGLPLAPKHAFAGGNKVSENLVANLLMVPGGTGTAIIGQRLFDALSDHPAYQKPAEQGR